MHLAWYVQDISVDGAVDSILLSGAWPTCQIPRNFSQVTKCFFFILAKILGKKKEDTCWKGR